MENINDPNNIMGMADIYADDNEMVDSLKIEKKIDKLNKEDPSGLEAELRILEAEEAELDR